MPLSSNKLRYLLKERLKMRLELDRCRVLAQSQSMNPMIRIRHGCCRTANADAVEHYEAKLADVERQIKGKFCSVREPAKIKQLRGRTRLVEITSQWKEYKMLVLLPSDLLGMQIFALKV